MAEPGKINYKLESGLTETQFQELLDNSILTQKEKENILSIFTKVSKEDGELSLDDWDAFIKETDRNKDNVLTNTELNNATTRKSSGLFQMNKSNLMDFYNVIINCLYKSQNENISHDKSMYVHYAPKNKYRKAGGGNGTFDGNWLARDEYNSKTFDEWLENNEYEIDIETAENLYKQAIKRRGYSRNCAKAIRESLQTTDSSSYSHLREVQNSDSDDVEIENEELFKDVKLFNGMTQQLRAYQYASELAQNPYFKELPHNIVSTMDLTKLPKGCVVVYDAFYKYSPNAKDNDSRYHKNGHISVTDGEGKDTGGTRNIDMALGKQATHIRVFIPIKISPVYKLPEE